MASMRGHLTTPHGVSPIFRQCGIMAEDTKAHSGETVVDLEEKPRI